MRRIQRGLWIVSLLAALVACEDVETPDLDIGSLEVSPGSAQLAVGDTTRLVSMPKAADGTVPGKVQVTWSVDDTSVAAVTPQGLSARVLMKKAAPAVITATATVPGGSTRTATATVAGVNPAPHLAHLQPAAALAQSASLTVTLTGSGFTPASEVLWNGQARATTWVSATTLRVELEAADLAAPVIAALAVRNPSPGGGASQPLPFQVQQVPVMVVDLDRTAATLPTGQSLRLTATPRDFLGRPLDRTVEWRSGSTAVATVDASGLVQAVGAGVAVITATSEAAFASAIITVTHAAATILSISPDSVARPMDGHGVDITVTGTGFQPDMVLFVNSTSRFAEVITASELRATLPWDDVRQTGTLRVRLYHPPTQTWSNEKLLRVHPDLEYLVVAPGQALMFEGEVLQLQAVGRDAAGNSYHHAVTWVSESPGIATVDGAGNVRAVALGQAAIRATMKGRSQLALITVVPAPAWDLLYESDRSGRPELWLVTPGSSAAPRRVLPPNIFAADPAVSPDGNSIAYVGVDETGNRDIYVANRDGTGIRRLTTAAGEDDQPTWSPDGTRIAFRSHRTGYRDLWVMNADGSDQHYVTGGSGPRFGVPSAWRPTWSPDGQRIAFSFGDLSVQPFRPTILSMKPAGDDVRLLATTAQGAFDPAYSPDGQFLIFRGELFGQPDQLQITTASGGTLGWLFYPGHGMLPAWSPDSNWIAYVSGEDTSVPSDVYIAQVGSPLRRRITVGNAAGGGTRPVWIRR